MLASSVFLKKQGKERGFRLALIAASILLIVAGTVLSIRDLL
jgi:hypothetical protein